MANITELPNAFTPLAFLPPALANQFEVSRYLYAATLGVSASHLHASTSFVYPFVLIGIYMGHRIEPWK